MTPEIEAALKGHPDTITAHGILAREITDLRARLAASEAECLEQARLNGMGSEREAALLAKLAASEARVRSLESGEDQDYPWKRALAESERKREEAERALGALRDSVQDVLWAGTEWQTDPSINGCLNSEQRLKESLARLEALLPPAKKSQEGA